MGCVMLSFAEDATINRYGGRWSGLLIVILWLLPLIPFAVWAFLHERFLFQRVWIKNRFTEHPISLVLIVVMFLVVGTSQIERIASTFTKKTVAPTVAANPAPTLQNPVQIAPSQQAPTAPEVKTQEQKARSVPSTQRATSKSSAPAGQQNLTTEKGRLNGTDNTILNEGGLAIGNGAKAGSTSVAIGAHANAEGGVPPPQSITADHGVAIGGSAKVQNSTVNNYGPKERHVSEQQKIGLAQLAESIPKECMVVFGSGDTGEPENLSKN
jgi:hypothetical protein